MQCHDFYLYIEVPICFINSVVNGGAQNEEDVVTGVSLYRCMQCHDFYLYIDVPICFINSVVNGGAQNEEDVVTGVSLPAHQGEAPCSTENISMIVVTSAAGDKRTCLVYPDAGSKESSHVAQHNFKVEKHFPANSEWMFAPSATGFSNAVITMGFLRHWEEMTRYAQLVYFVMFSSLFHLYTTQKYRIACHIL